MVQRLFGQGDTVISCPQCGAPLARPLQAPTTLRCARCNVDFEVSLAPMAAGATSIARDVDKAIASEVKRAAREMRRALLLARRRAR
jgi:uncharacterized Zn finger protein (UPF0148 family)